MYVCHSEGEWARQDLSASEQVMVVGARRTGVSFSRSTVSCVYQEWFTIQRRFSELDTTVGSIGVNMGQHPCGTLSTPCRVHALD